MIRRIQYSLTKYSSFSVKHFDRYKAKVSHMTETYNRKVHKHIQHIYKHEKGTYFPSFTKMRGMFLLEFKPTEFVVESSLRHMSQKNGLLYLAVKFPHFLAKLSPYICHVILD